MNNPEYCPGIRQTVLWLQSLGYETTDSGDGYSNEGMEGALDFPHVVIHLDLPANLIAEADRLMEILAAKGIDFTPVDMDSPYVEASYQPAKPSAMLFLGNVSDKMLFP